MWLYAGHRPALTGGAAFYGRLEGEKSDLKPLYPIGLASGRLAPVVGLYGGADKGIPLESVYSMRKQLAEAGQTSEILIFPTAPHGFHADYRASYRESCPRGRLGAGPWSGTSASGANGPGTDPRTGIGSSQVFFPWGNCGGRPPRSKILILFASIFMTGRSRPGAVGRAVPGPPR